MYRITVNWMSSEEPEEVYVPAEEYEGRRRNRRGGCEHGPPG
jgi:hypothetical protein